MTRICDRIVDWNSLYDKSITIRFPLYTENNYAYYPNLDCIRNLSVDGINVFMENELFYMTIPTSTVCKITKKSDSSYLLCSKSKSGGRTFIFKNFVFNSRGTIIAMPVIKFKMEDDSSLSRIDEPIFLVNKDLFDRQYLDIAVSARNWIENTIYEVAGSLRFSVHISRDPLPRCQILNGVSSVSRAVAMQRELVDIFYKPSGYTRCDCEYFDELFHVFSPNKLMMVNNCPVITEIDGNLISLWENETHEEERRKSEDSGSENNIV